MNKYVFATAVSAPGTRGGHFIKGRMAHSLMALVLAAAALMMADAGSFGDRRAHVLLRRAPGGNAGKTILPLRVAEALPGCRLVVVMVPDKALVARSASEWCHWGMGNWERLSMRESSLDEREQQNVQVFLEEPGQRVIFATFRAARALPRLLLDSGRTVDLLVNDLSACRRVDEDVDLSFIAARYNLCLRSHSGMAASLTYAEYEAFGACAFRLQHDNGGDGGALLGVLQPPLRLMTLEVAAVHRRLLEGATPPKLAPATGGSTQRTAAIEAAAAGASAKGAAKEYAELALAVLYIYCLLDR